jgi:hypothetical protein
LDNDIRIHSRKVHPDQTHQADVGNRHIGLEPEFEIAEEEEEEGQKQKEQKDSNRSHDQSANRIALS